MATKPRKAAPKAAKTVDRSAPTSSSKDAVMDLVARVDKLERNQSLLREGFTFAANECRPLFSFGPLALIFDAIAEKLQK